MRVKIRTVIHGPGPSEAIVAIDGKEGGQEEVVVDRRLICDDTIEVARVDAHNRSPPLVELPRESASGCRRICVDSANLLRLLPPGAGQMILTDREIAIALESRQIIIDPQPSAEVLGPVRQA